MVHKPEDLADFFRTRKIEFNRCLEPTFQCEQEAIRAHSIQNNRTIELLAKKNHVIAWQPRFSQAGPDIQLRQVGRNEASTFFGFCNHHDTELFKSLDSKPLDVNDREQLFLLAYRGISCELHAIMNGVVQLQCFYTDRIKRGAEPQDASSVIGTKAVEQMLLSWALWRYRHKYYDEQLLSQSFANIEHDIIELNDQPPCLAASSFFTLRDESIDKELVGTAINILPISETKTYAVFSYAFQDRGIVHASLDRVLHSHGEYQKYELSKLILSRISNVLISPHRFENWGSTKTKKITEAFVHTLRTKQDVEDDSELILF